MMGKDETPWEELKERYASPFGENSGWFFPQEYFEPLVQQYFAVSTQHLRSNPDFYCPQEGGYYVPFGGGKGEQPEIILNQVEKEGELRRLHISLPYTSQLAENRVLTIRLEEDGSYQYQSYLEEA